jgi:F-type H+-transporting ATPase subunit gamma
MATNTREIKDRIASVEKTKKITQAMKMVSAAKFKRNLKVLDQLKGYGNGLDSIISSVSKRLSSDDVPGLLCPNESPQVAIIIIGSDRGLCGGFNSNLFKTAEGFIEKHNQVDVYTIGNKVYQFYKSKNVNVVDSQSGFTALGNDSGADQFMNGLVASFKKGVYSKVFVIYNEFVSALASNHVIKQLLPIELPNWTPNTTTTSDFIYETSKPSALNRLFQLYISYAFSRSIQESLASEDGFRMAAMDSASNNAKEMIQDLTLYFNRSRQAAITTELTEIVAGAASIS